MPLILNLESATRNCSVSLSNNSETVALREFAGEGYSHAEKLHKFIDEVLASANLKFNQIDAVAVSQGPGSYTGLRIGVSAAKGLCYALKIPMIALDTLLVLASSANVHDGLIVPMIDARRMEIYSAIFNPDFSIVRSVEAQVITENSFEEIKEHITILGDCNQKVKEVLSRKDITYLDIEYPSAKKMARWSSEKFAKKDFVDIAYFEPRYLKEFVGTAPRPVKNPL